jgi:hypothetical protein
LGVLPIFVNGEAFGGKEFVAVNGLVHTVRAQAVLSFKFDVGGEDMDGVGTVSNWNKEVGDAPFILLVSLRLPLVVSVFLEFLVMVRFSILVGFFQVSCVLFMLCQSISSFFKGGELCVVGLGVGLVLSSNSSQSSCNEDKLFPAGTVSFESGASSSRGEA